MCSVHSLQLTVIQTKPAPMGPKLLLTIPCRLFSVLTRSFKGLFILLQVSQFLTGTMMASAVLTWLMLASSSSFPEQSQLHHPLKLDFMTSGCYYLNHDSLQHYCPGPWWSHVTFLNWSWHLQLFFSEPWSSSRCSYLNLGGLQLLLPEPR